MKLKEASKGVVRERMGKLPSQDELQEKLDSLQYTPVEYAIKFGVDICVRGMEIFYDREQEKRVFYEGLTLFKTMEELEEEEGFLGHEEEIVIRMMLAKVLCYLEE